MCELTDLVHEHEAKKRWAANEAPSFSTSVVDQLTCGYGKLSEYGYWQFPLYPAEKYLKLHKRKIDSSLRRGDLLKAFSQLT